MVMLSNTAWLPDWTTKSSGSKTMTLPMRPFLEKSFSFGPSDFLFQKKPETGTLRGHSRASTSSSANARADVLSLEAQSLDYAAGFRVSSDKIAF